MEPVPSPPTSEPTPQEQAIANLNKACQDMADACTAAVNAGIPIHEVMARASQALVNPGS